MSYTRIKLSSTYSPFPLPSCPISFLGGGGGRNISNHVSKHTASKSSSSFVKQTSCRSIKHTLMDFLIEELPGVSWIPSVIVYVAGRLWGGRQAGAGWSGGGNISQHLQLSLSPTPVIFPAQHLSINPCLPLVLCFPQICLSQPSISLILTLQACWLTLAIYPPYFL